MREGDDRVRCAAIITRAKLGERDERVGKIVMENSCGDDFLQQFPAALQESDGPVCLRMAVVRLARFREDDDVAFFPRVVAQGQARVVEGDEAEGDSLVDACLGWRMGTRLPASRGEGVLASGCKISGSAISPCSMKPSPLPIRRRYRLPP